jgi:hypothetical protein
MLGFEHWQQHRMAARFKGGCTTGWWSRCLVKGGGLHRLGVKQRFSQGWVFSVTQGRWCAQSNNTAVRARCAACRCKGTGSSVRQQHQATWLRLGGRLVSMGCRSSVAAQNCCLGGMSSLMSIMSRAKLTAQGKLRSAWGTSSSAGHQRV